MPYNIIVRAKLILFACRGLGTTQIAKRLSISDRSVRIESGSRDEPLRHLRLRRETVHLWRLDIAGRRGRWESTPLRGNLDSLITAVTRDFAWVRTPLA